MVTNHCVSELPMKETCFDNKKVCNELITMHYLPLLIITLSYYGDCLQV